MNVPEALTRPLFTATPDEFLFSWDNGVEASVERITEHRDELTAEVTIRSRREPKAGLLHSARLNLMSTQARRTLATTLTVRDADIDWGGALEQLCFLTRERYRAGEPSIDMRFYEPSTAARWLVEPFVERSGVTVLFADGGSGKSIIALAIAVTAASGATIIGRREGAPVAVLYADWETDADTFHERLNSIVVGAGVNAIPPVLYRRLVASLPESAAALRREILRDNVGLVVLDSLGLARGGEPESADMTLRMFAAARSLGVPILAVDHVTKAQGNDSTRPFGSTYTHNIARLTWGLDKAEEADSTVVSLVNRKRNNGRLMPRVAYRITFASDALDALTSVNFRRCDPGDVPELAAKMPLRQRILIELRDGPMAIPRIAEGLGYDEKQVGARVGEMVKRSELVRLEDHRVALAARRSA